MNMQIYPDTVKQKQDEIKLKLTDLFLLELFTNKITTNKDILVGLFDIKFYKINIKLIKFFFRILLNK